jgi:hypothetical protein
MNDLLLGAVAMASAVATTFFARFWYKTRDRLFLMFALAFAVDAVVRVLLAVGQPADEQQPLFYLARLVSFGLIAFAIVDKNRG